MTITKQILKSMDHADFALFPQGSPTPSFRSSLISCLVDRALESRRRLVCSTINRFADLKIGYDPANPEDWGIRIRLVVAITNAMDELF